MEPLADPSGFLLLRANLTRSVKKTKGKRATMSFCMKKAVFIDRISLTFHTIV